MSTYTPSHDTEPYLFIDYSALAAEHGVKLKFTPRAGLAVEVNAERPGMFPVPATLELSAANDLYLCFVDELVPLRLCQVEECGDQLLVHVTADRIAHRGQWLMGAAAYRALSAIRRVRRPA